MEDNRKGFGGDDKKIRFQRQSKSFKLSQLGSYKTGYTSDDFLIDLAKYFDQEVDFNLDKIRKEIEQPQKLAGLIVKAKEKNTHPVAEFVEELFKGLTAWNLNKDWFKRRVFL